MNKFSTGIVCFALLGTFTFALGGKDNTGSVAASAIAAAQNMTHEEIEAKAKEEAAAAKSSGTVFKAYGTSSRIADAAKSFTARYGIDVETTNVKDSEIYTKLEAEIGGNVDGADVVLTQNGAVLKIQMLNTGYLLNYIPALAEAKFDQEDKSPLVQQYLNKLIIFNTAGGKTPDITNVWQLCEPEMKGKVFFKSPETEKVNENFLIMLTSPAWAERLAKAYKDLYGKDIELGQFKNAGYKWVAEFLTTCSFGDSDTKVAEQISSDEAAGKTGLFVFSKLRSKTVKTANLKPAAFYADEKNTKMQPFAGFMYPLYVLMAKTTTMPYTSMLFIEHLVSDEGFAPWKKSLGAYSPNHDIGVNKGDKPLAYWKDCLVMEDPEYINKAYADVFEFISKYISK